MDVLPFLSPAAQSVVVSEDGLAAIACGEQLRFVDLPPQLHAQLGNGLPPVAPLDHYEDLLRSAPPITAASLRPSSREVVPAATTPAQAQLRAMRQGLSGQRVVGAQSWIAGAAWSPPGLLSHDVTACMIAVACDGGYMQLCAPAGALGLVPALSSVHARTGWDRRDWVPLLPKGLVQELQGSLHPTCFSFSPAVVSSSNGNGNGPPGSSGGAGGISRRCILATGGRAGLQFLLIEAQQHRTYLSTPPITITHLQHQSSSSTSSAALPVTSLACLACKEDDNSGGAGAGAAGEPEDGGMLQATFVVGTSDGEVHVVNVIVAMRSDGDNDAGAGAGAGSSAGAGVSPRTVPEGQEQLGLSAPLASVSMTTTKLVGVVGGSIAHLAWMRHESGSSAGHGDASSRALALAFAWGGNIGVWVPGASSHVTSAQPSHGQLQAVETIDTGAADVVGLGFLRGPVRVRRGAHGAAVTGLGLVRRVPFGSHRAMGDDDDNDGDHGPVLHVVSTSVDGTVLAWDLASHKATLLYTAPRPRSRRSTCRDGPAVLQGLWTGAGGLLAATVAVQESDSRLTGNRTHPSMEGRVVALPLAPVPGPVELLADAMEAEPGAGTDTVPQSPLSSPGQAASYVRTVVRAALLSCVGEVMATVQRALPTVGPPTSDPSSASASNAPSTADVRPLCAGLTAPLLMYGQLACKLMRARARAVTATAGQARLTQGVAGVSASSGSSGTYGTDHALTDPSFPHSLVLDPATLAGAAQDLAGRLGQAGAASSSSSLSAAGSSCGALTADSAHLTGSDDLCLELLQLLPAVLQACLTYRPSPGAGLAVAMAVLSAVMDRAQDEVGASAVQEGPGATSKGPGAPLLAYLGHVQPLLCHTPALAGRAHPVLSSGAYRVGEGMPGQWARYAEGCMGLLKQAKVLHPADSPGGTAHQAVPTVVCRVADSNGRITDVPAGTPSGGRTNAALEHWAARKDDAGAAGSSAGPKAAKASASKSKGRTQAAVPKPRPALSQPSGAGRSSGSLSADVAAPAAGGRARRAAAVRATAAMHQLSASMRLGGADDTSPESSGAGRGRGRAAKKWKRSVEDEDDDDSVSESEVEEDEEEDEDDDVDLVDDDDDDGTEPEDDEDEEY